MNTIFSNPVRRTVLTLGLAATIAAGSVGLMATANAAPNNNPKSDHDVVCNAVQAAYDSDVQSYERATTDAARSAARANVYSDIDSYYAEGCDIDHGPINFRQANPDLTQKAPVGGKQQTTTPVQGPGQQVGGTVSRVK